MYYELIFFRNQVTNGGKIGRLQLQDIVSG
jgi:hypothetical protein